MMSQEVTARYLYWEIQTGNTDAYPAQTVVGFQFDEGDPNVQFPVVVHGGCDSSFAGCRGLAMNTLRTVALRVRPPSNIVIFYITDFPPGIDSPIAIPTRLRFYVYDGSHQLTIWHRQAPGFLPGVQFIENWVPVSSGPNPDPPPLQAVRIGQGWRTLIIDVWKLGRADEDPTGAVPLTSTNEYKFEPPPPL
jgi:hypothetical protein